MPLARMVPVLLTVGATLLLASPAIGGGGGGGSAPCPAFSADRADEVVLRDFCFDPIGIEAAPGTTLKVRNDGQQPHTFTATDGSFDTGALAAGESATVTVPREAPAVVPVYCTLHADRAGNGMAGSLSLVSSAGTQAATTSSSGSGSLVLAAAAGLVAGVGGSTWLSRRNTRRGQAPVRANDGEA